MNKWKNSVLAALLATPILLSACTPAQRQDAATKGQEVASNAADGAKALGEKAGELAGKAKEEAQGLIDKISKSDAVPTQEEVKTGWDNLKQKFSDMAANATSPETKQKIEDAKTALETKFNEVSTSLNNNENVQGAKEKVVAFFNEVKAKIQELMGQ